jgi:uncharacterized protein YigA (DUF484 family)
MRQRELSDLINAVGDVLDRRVGQDGGYMLIVMHRVEAGEVWYRTDLDEQVAAGLLDGTAEHLRAVWSREI